MEAALKTKKLVLLNSVSEAKDYIDNYLAQDTAGNTLLIGMNPSIRAHLVRKGLAPADTSDYFTTDSHVNTLRKSDELVKWLEANASFADTGLGVHRAYRDFFIYWIRFAIHYCIWAIEVASAAVELHKPEVICAYNPGKSMVSSLYIENEEGYFGRLIEDTAKARGLEFRNLYRCKSAVEEERGLRSTYMRSLARFVLQNIKFSLWEIAVWVRNIYPGKAAVFFTTRFYNLDKLAKDFIKNNGNKRAEILRGPVIFTYGLSNAVIRLFGGRYSGGIISQKNNFDDIEGKIGKSSGLFSYKGVSFADAVSGKIKDNIGGHIMGLMLWTVKLNDFIDRSKAALFVSNGNRADDVILAELCAKKGIRTLLISHGSHVRPKNGSEMIEWGEHGRALLRAPFSHIALQTPVAQGYLDVFRTESRTIKTGPLIWGKPVKRAGQSGAKTIVHAGTPKPVNSLRPFVYETPDEYIRGIRELAEAVEKVPGTVLNVRFRPSSDIGAEDIKALVPFSEKVRLSMDGPFSDALGAADFLVSFSSTTIEEALQNRIPVLEYGGGGRYSHVAAFEIKEGAPIERSAVYHAAGPRELPYAIPGILRLGIDGWGADGKLFDGFIYPEGERVTLEKIIDDAK